MWPVTRAGYLLGHDLVFTPRQPLGWEALGLGSAAPRAVPVDALVAVVERVVDGAVVARLAVVLPIVAAGLGTAALLRQLPVAARLTSVSLVVWNPYVVERLAIGQWALLWAYAAVPWLLVAVRAESGPAAWAGRAVALAAASITPTGGLIAAVTFVAASAAERRGRRELIESTALALVLQLPWIVPGLVSSAAKTSDPAGVVAFAARGEHPGGALVSLLGGGGIWDADVTPGSRSGALPWFGLVLLVVAAAYGGTRLRDEFGRRLMAALVASAVAGLVVALLPSVPGGVAVARALVAHVPGAGLLRDAQKWVLLLVVMEALLAGAAVARLLDRLAAASWRWSVAIAGAALPLVLLPDGPATLRPTITPVHYPADWAAVARAVHGPGAAVVLPWGAYRSFSWTHVGSVLDPAPRLLPVPTVTDDRLVVSGRVLRGEDARAARVGRGLSTPTKVTAGLAAAGVRWVVVEHGTPGPVVVRGEWQLVHAGRDVSLYRVPGRVRSDGPGSGRAVAVLTADLLALGVLLALLLRTLIVKTRRKARGAEIGR